MEKRAVVSLGVGIFLLVLSLERSPAAVSTYFGNHNVAGGVVSDGSLVLSGSSSKVNVTFNRGGTPSASFSDILVLYIDSSAGGIHDTSGLVTRTTELQRAISGFANDGSRAVANFADGFLADYALAIGPSQNGGMLYHIGALGVLESGQNISFTSPIDQFTYPTYTFSFNWSSIGLTGAAGDSFAFESSYSVGSGYRSLQSYEPLTGLSGFNATTFGGFHIFPAPVPEPVNVALAVFGVTVTTVGILSHRRRRRGVSVEFQLEDKRAESGKGSDD